MIQDPTFTSAHSRANYRPFLSSVIIISFFHTLKESGFGLDQDWISGFGTVIFATKALVGTIECGFHTVQWE